MADVNIRDHQTWLGYLQPEGLVVSPAALVDSQVILPRDTAELQQDFLAWIDDTESERPHISDFETFAEAFLGWSSDILIPAGDDLEHTEPGMEEILRPTNALKDPSPKDPAKPYLVLIQVVPKDADLDKQTSGDAAGWTASPTQRLVRLLQAKEVPIGLIFNGIQTRLVYAPKAESPGWITFPVPAMAEVAGRPILAAFHLLLERYRLISGPENARLPALLHRSRQYQSTVSTQLAGQVLDALYELLRGFESANHRSKGKLLEKTLEESPNDIYHGLLTVLMRLVFLLYAEDKGVMPNTDLYNQHFSMHGLHERLRQDQERYPDTMGDRFGAWAQLLTLFRAIYQGCDHPLLNMPARHGYLFDPARFPFLDGASIEGEIPLVPDGTIYAVLKELLILNGERLSYRTLDVEQMGSVYEVMMGFRLLVANGPSVALKPKKKLGAPTVINLDSLLAVKGSERAKWLKEQADQEVSAANAKPLVEAGSVDDLVQALQSRIALAATPHLVHAGALLLQPGEDRRRSGTNYTPRSLTEPIVAKTLEPILDRLGPDVTPEQILDLKVCDPAMGSGAFLVAVCRSLGSFLVDSWTRYRRTPPITEGETALLVAMRMVAQRCVYGVDKNPMATELAKLSLWLVTLAKDHAFTFLDHNLRAGDSLVGIDREQLYRFHWDRNSKQVYAAQRLPMILEEIRSLRTQIASFQGEDDYDLQAEKLEKVKSIVRPLIFLGDAVVAGFFDASDAKKKEELRKSLLEHTRLLFVDESHIGSVPTDTIERINRAHDLLLPFHWEFEFPEVFFQENPGFDAIVGNPPFAGKNTVIAGHPAEYPKWLLAIHEESHGNADLVAHFFRRSFNLLRKQGAFGLIATNTIAQGDTRSSGLRWICTRGGDLYAVKRRYKWPGAAAVVVSVIHSLKGRYTGTRFLDGAKVERITAFLFHQGENKDPSPLSANAKKSFVGVQVHGIGMTFDDSSLAKGALPLAESVALIEKDPSNSEIIRPLMGWEEITDSPLHLPVRAVIDFQGMSEAEASRWPSLMDIIRERVKPTRMLDNRAAYRDRWWQFAERRPELSERKARAHRVLACSAKATTHLSFAMIPSRIVLTYATNVIVESSTSFFATLQCRVHETWARFFGSSMKDDLTYTASMCFETFPFPKTWKTDPDLEAIGKEYYEFRAELMIRNNEGLTKTYNRFHDPSETGPEILRLRELHEAMDRAVLAAYGWPDIPTACEFLLDYEEDEPDEANQDLFGQPKKKGKGKKKPYRFRWPDEVRDEVLARLLALNAERHAEEVRLGIAPGMGRKKGIRPEADLNSLDLDG